MQNKFYGQYRGIVVQNDDPEYRGRVKVFVPNVNMALYQQWNDQAKVDAEDGHDLKYAFLGSNVASDLMPVLLRLKHCLPWAETAQPMLGACSSGFYNSPNDRAKIDYSNEEMSGVREQCTSDESKQQQQADNEQKSKTKKGPGPTAQDSNFSPQLQQMVVASLSSFSADPPSIPASTKQEDIIINRPDVDPWIRQDIIDLQRPYFIPHYPMAAYGESGLLWTDQDPYGVGAISDDNLSDPKGKSYGTYQIGTNQQTFAIADDCTQSTSAMELFLQQDNRFSKKLRTVGAIGSPQFDRAWLDLSVNDNRSFGRAQERFVETLVSHSKQIFVSTIQTDLAKMPSALDDLIFGTVWQYGVISQRIATYVKAHNVSSGDGIATLIQKYKQQTLSAYFSFVEPDIKDSIANRITRELSPFTPDANLGSPAGIPQQPQTNSRPTVGGSSSKGNRQKQRPHIGSSPQKQSDTCGSSSSSSYTKDPIYDGFSKGGSDQEDRPLNNCHNPYANMYRPPHYANKAMGAFSIPNVGAHVWVFFEQGNPQYPIVWGAAYGKEDYAGVWDAHQDDNEQTAQTVSDGYGEELSQGGGPDYPAEYENRPTQEGEQTSDDDIYRNKMVINQRGGGMEIVSTYDREKVTLYHFGGSHLQFNKFTTTRLATENDQVVVIKDRFQTVQGYCNVKVHKDFDTICLGDIYVKVGDCRTWKPVTDKIKKLLTPIHDKKRLFDLMRTVQVDDMDQSPLQQIDGSFVACPVCAQGKQYVQIRTQRADRLIDDIQLQCGTGTSCFGSKSRALQKGEEILQAFSGNGGNMYEEPCWCCGGTGKSPATQDGDWSPDQVKQQIGQDIVTLQRDELTQLERQLGSAVHREGGNVLENIAMDQNTLVGLTFNDLTPYRKDPIGKLVPYGVKIERGGVYPQFIQSPLVEAVDAIIPSIGGQSHIVACQRLGFSSGSGGTTIKTTGPLDLFGAMIRLAGEHIAISSRSEVSVDAGSRFDVEADIITLRPRIVEKNGEQLKQVGIMGNLNVSNNITVRGGTHIEGELSLQHITAPLEWHQTNVEPSITNANMLEGHHIGNVIIASGSSAGTWPVYSICAPKCIEVDPHGHWVQGPPWTLMESHEQVRETGARCNGVTVVAPHPIAAVQDADIECFPQGMDPGYTTCSNPSRWTPDQGPNGQDSLMAPDPDLEGLGDGTTTTDTPTTKQRTTEIEQLAKQGRDAVAQKQQEIEQKYPAIQPKPHRPVSH